MNPLLPALIHLPLWIILSLAPFSLSQPAQSKEPASCSAALQNVQAQLKAKTNLEIVSVTKRNVTETYPDHPKGRPDWYVFSLRGRQAENLLNSPRFMTTLASQIIRSCENTSLVMFGFANSGYTVLLGLMPDGSVQPFECLEPGRGSSNRPAWGKTICV